MINYNIIITEAKVINTYLNLDVEEFLETLWDWCYEDDLWDNIEVLDLLSNNEMLINYICDTFIPENIYHRYEDDDLDCFTFTVSDEDLKVKQFDNQEMLLNFIMDKIKKHYNGHNTNSN